MPDLLEKEREGTNWIKEEEREVGGWVEEKRWVGARSQETGEEIAVYHVSVWLILSLHGH